MFLQSFICVVSCLVCSGAFDLPLKSEEEWRVKRSFNNQDPRGPCQTWKNIPRTAGNIQTCSNGVCDVGELESCPGDCCPSRNPGRCAVAHGSCPPECCGTSNCCVEEKSKNILKIFFMCATPPFGCFCIGCFWYWYWHRNRNKKNSIGVVMLVQEAPGAKDSSPSCNFPPMDTDISCGYSCDCV